MADNKFLIRLKGKQAPKSSVQIDEDKLSPVFSNMPVGSDGFENIIDQSKSSTIVAKGSQNWYLSGDSMVLSDSDQYTSEFKVNGQGLWINSSYTFTSASVIAPSAKWVLRFCGNNLLDATDHKITLSVLIKAGSTTLATKTFVLDEQANFFCKVLELDFNDTYQSVHKFAVGSTLTVQLLCANDGASATIYNGKTTLTLLQRMIDAETIAFNGTPLIDVMTGHVAEDYFNRYQEQVVDGDKGMPVFSRAGTQMELSGWEEKTTVQVAEHNTSDEAHEDIRAEVATKQDQLTAGYNITIDENNVISATSEIGSRFSDLLGSPYENENLAEALNTKADEADLQAHITNKDNPHEVTKAQVGLGNVDDTSDADKPISTATQSALDLKANSADLGTAAYTDSTDYATAAQGTKADSAIQPNDNISELTNDATYQTQAQVNTAISAHNTSETAHQDIRAAVNGKQDTLTAGDNIDITDNVISATDTTYSAGNGLTLTGTTFSANVVNNTTSDSTTDALSAAAGKSLQEQVNNLLGRGKYLSVWDCTTGLAMDEPPVNPYTIETGSYFIVGKVASAGGVNYRPNGGVYDKDVPSTTVETGSIKVNDTYFYDGTQWRLLDTPVTDVAFSTLAGSPYDNANLENALDAKANTTDLATVATSGSYNDLSNKPTIPAAQVPADWNATTGVARILNKPTIPTVPTNISAFTNDSNYQTGAQVSSAISTHNSSASAHSDIRTTLNAKANSADLATVATSGSYTDLSNTPTIPTTLAGLTGDVSISSPTNGQHLVYDGAKWKNTNSAATVSWGDINGTLSNQEDLQSALNGKADVATTLSGYGITDGANTDLSNITNAGKEVCANMSMPSTRYVDLTVGASGASYTMPADGYIFMSATSTAAGQNIQLSGGLNTRVYSNAASQGWRIWLPVRKGLIVTANYSMPNSIELRFIYAEGAQ